MVIGITGGIGSGKSTLAAYLRQHGYPVYDTDAQARIIQNSDPGVIKKTIELFGRDVYKNHELDRKFVASKVFNNSVLLKALTEIVHPAVKRDIVSWLKKHNKVEYLFIESAVMFEGGFNKFTDKILLVTATEKIRIERVMKRDGVTKEQVLARIKNQIPDDLKVPESDLVINTDAGIPANILELIVVW